MFESSRISHDGWTKEVGMCLLFVHITACFGKLIWVDVDSFRGSNSFGSETSARSAFWNKVLSQNSNYSNRLLLEICVHIQYD